MLSNLSAIWRLRYYTVVRKQAKTGRSGKTVHSIKVLPGFVPRSRLLRSSHTSATHIRLVVRGAMRFG